LDVAVITLALPGGKLSGGLEEYRHLTLARSVLPHYLFIHDLFFVWSGYDGIAFMGASKAYGNLQDLTGLQLCMKL